MNQSFPHGPLPFWQWSETSRPRQIWPTLEFYGIVTLCHIMSHFTFKLQDIVSLNKMSTARRTFALSFSKNDTKKYCYAHTWAVTQVTYYLLLPKNPGIKHPYSVLKCPVSYSCLRVPNSRGVIATLVACTVGLRRLQFFSG